jgi:signal transduction histidine kinase
LITNAVEAMEGEGTITLSTSRQDGMVACAVADTGCGMSEAFIRNSLFVPFQTTKKGGWGIGLYQAREIVTSHGGRIEIASLEGRGTTVTLLLPEEQP